MKGVLEREGSMGPVQVGVRSEWTLGCIFQEIKQSLLEQGVWYLLDLERYNISHQD